MTTPSGQVVLIFGGAGFLGSHIVARLLEREYARTKSSTTGHTDINAENAAQEQSPRVVSPAPIDLEKQYKERNPIPVPIADSLRRGRTMLEHSVALENSSECDPSRVSECVPSEAVSSSRVSEIRVFDLQEFDVAVLGLGFASEEARVTVRSIRASICAEDDVREALVGVTEVYQCCSLVDPLPRFSVPQKMMDVNVHANRSILSLAPEAGVRRLVYTSSMDVALPWKPKVIEHATEASLPVLSRLKDFQYGAYGQTKAIAEEDVREADRTALKRRSADGQGSSGPDDVMRTASIRPVILHGERDVHNLPTVLKAVDDGQLTVQMGKNPGNNQPAYAGNVAWAHVCAMDMLRTDPDKVGGEAFYGQDDNEGQTLFEWMAPYVEAHGAAMPTKSLPGCLFMGIAHCLECISCCISPCANFRPMLTPGTTSAALYTRTFSDEKARTVLKYKPLFTPEEGMALTMQYFGLQKPSSNYGTFAKENE